MTVIVFSRDRAMQLHAFLRSYERHVTPRGAVQVLYHATTERHAKAYAELFQRFTFTWPTEQTVFKRDLLTLLPTTGHVVFFVDDQVFVRPWAVREVAGLSLRLGLHLTSNYVSSDAPQPLPADLRRIDAGLWTWTWSGGAMAWGYPLSLDGHVFGGDEMRRCIEAVEFRSPNTLESQLQQFLPRFLHRSGFCYRESKVVSIPINQVQEDWYNRCANGPSAEELLTAWEQRWQINLAGIDGAMNVSVHQEFPIVLEPRDDRI